MVACPTRQSIPVVQGLKTLLPSYSDLLILTSSAPAIDSTCSLTELDTAYTDRPDLSYPPSTLNPTHFINFNTSQDREILSGEPIASSPVFALVFS